MWALLQHSSGESAALCQAEWAGCWPWLQSMRWCCWLWLKMLLKCRDTALCPHSHSAICYLSVSTCSGTAYHDEYMQKWMASENSVGCIPAGMNEAIPTGRRATEPFGHKLSPTTCHQRAFYLLILMQPEWLKLVEKTVLYFSFCLQTVIMEFHVNGLFSEILSVSQVLGATIHWYIDTSIARIQWGHNKTAFFFFWNWSLSN